MFMPAAEVLLSVDRCERSPLKLLCMLFREDSDEFNF